MVRVTQVGAIIKGRRHWQISQWLQPRKVPWAATAPDQLLGGRHWWGGRWGERIYFVGRGVVFSKLVIFISGNTAFSYRQNSAGTKPTCDTVHTNNAAGFHRIYEKEGVHALPHTHSYHLILTNKAKYIQFQAHTPFTKFINTNYQLHGSSVTSSNPSPNYA